MTLIVWNESIPSGTSRAGNAPTDFPRVWKAITSGMTTEHFWSASGGASAASCGELLPGASRTEIVARAANVVAEFSSQVSGRLALVDADSGTSFVPLRIHTYDSTGTYMVGSVWMDEHADDCGTGYWMRQSGSTTGIATGLGSSVITFPVPYTAAPKVFLSTSNASWILWVAGVTISGPNAFKNVVSGYSSRAGAAGTNTIYWEALGPVSSVSY